MRPEDAEWEIYNSLSRLFGERFHEGGWDIRCRKERKGIVCEVELQTNEFSARLVLRRESVEVNFFGKGKDALSLANDFTRLMAMASEVSSKL